MRILTLVTDAFGGRGGIARYSRDVLRATCAHPLCAEVVAVPRVMPEPAGALPAGLTYVTAGVGGKLAYARTVLGLCTGGRRFDGVVCGHINLLPLAYAAARRQRAPLVLVVYGIDAWQPTGNTMTARLSRRANAVVSISDYTTTKFLAWSGVERARVHLVPPCVDAEAFAPGPRPEYLVERYRLRGRRVITTVARLASKERYKGHDQIMSVFPELLEAYPDLSYVIVGDGDDRARLEARARWLGLGEQVVFTGHVPEAEKADHYRLADAFVMPGRKEGFGIVYLEALACGVPVVASKADASREAVLDGVMGQVVDPDDAEAVRDAIGVALANAGRGVPAQLGYFSEARFDERWWAVMNQVFVHEARARPAVAAVSA